MRIWELEKNVMEMSIFFAKATLWFIKYCYINVSKLALTCICLACRYTNTEFDFSVFQPFTVFKLVDLHVDELRDSCVELFARKIFIDRLSKAECEISFAKKTPENQRKRKRVE